MKKIFATLIGIALFSTLAYCQTSTTTNTPAVSISGTIENALNSVDVPAEVTKIQTSGLAVNTGIWYDWKQQQVDLTYTYPPFGSMNIDNWGTWDYINIGYASPDVLVAGTGLDINLAVVAKKWGLTNSNTPATIQDILNSASIGLTPMLGIEEVGGKNRFTGGPGGYIKVTF